MTLKELQEKRAKLAAEIKTQADAADGRDFTAEETQVWERVNGEYNAVTRDIGRLNRLEEIESEQRGIVDSLIPVGGEERQEERREEAHNAVEDRARATRAWMCSVADVPISEEDRAASRRLGLNPAAKTFSVPILNTSELRDQMRAGMSTSAAVGGYTIPEGFVPRFEHALLAFGGPRKVAEILRTASGNDLPWPSINDTTNTGEMLGEETSIGDTTNPAVGQTILKAYKMSSKLIQISPELLQDSAFNMASEIGMMLGERIGRIEATYYTTGAGASEPQGIVTGSTLGATTASATAIKADEIIDLIHSVDPAYREGGGCGFMMHDSIVKYIRKLKDGNGQFIWQQGTLAGEPDRLFGFPITINQAMASSVATTNKTMLFGQLAKFKIRDVADIRLRRLDERYADTDQVGFIAFHRTDSAVIDAGTHPIRYMLQA